MSRFQDKGPAPDEWRGNWPTLATSWEDAKRAMDKSWEKHVSLVRRKMGAELRKAGRLFLKINPKRSLRWLEGMGTYGFIVDDEYVTEMSDEKVRRCYSLRVLSDAEEAYGKLTADSQIDVGDITFK